MGRGSRGGGMMLESSQKIVSMISVPITKDSSKNFDNQTVFIATQNGFGKRTTLREFTRHSRGTKE